MKRTKETILAGLLTEEEKESVLKSVCSELEIPYKGFAYEGTVKNYSKFNNLYVIPNMYIVNSEEESMANLAVMSTNTDITQKSKIKNVIFFDEKINKYATLINSTLMHSLYNIEDSDDIGVNVMGLDYKIIADLRVDLDTFDDAYSFILSHIFDDAYMDAKLDLAYKVIESEESELNDNDFNSWEEMDASHL